LTNIKLNTLENVRDTIQNNLTAYRTAFMTNNPTISLPDVALYKIGYHDLFSLFDYPAVVISVDNRTNSNTDELALLTADVVFVMQWNDADELNYIALAYSDVIYNLLRDNHTLGNVVISTEITKEDHFFSRDTYIVDFTINVEREV